jgi:glyoxylase-like metal-dependent hydrolase (beta-lactamase superfamily II)/rhodanese-related sulfurtransferase
MVQVEVLATSELGDRSYVVHDGSTALVVDPQRDVDRVERLLADKGLRLAAVAETHIHNDYVTGGPALARAAGVDYLVSADDDVAYERRPVSDGETVEYGGLRVRVVHTPGHTFHHLTYVVRGADDDAPAVFTGGSLLYGSVGRTDLLGEDKAEELTRHQFRSAKRLDGLLDDDARIFPTHGFGSFCSAGSASGAESSTLGDERATNDALTTADEDAFVEQLLANLTAYPAYYAHMAALNTAGPPAPDLSPPEAVDAHELRRRIEDGEWVVDLRSRRAYAAGHVSGTVGIELGSEQFSTYLGWLMPWGTPVTLIGKDAESVATAQRQMARIGIERPAGAATTPVEELTDEPGSYRRASFADLRDEVEGTVLDVRQDNERSESAIPGSLHVPIHEVLDRMDELPDDETLWVHCASGFRASIATSLLHRAGYDVVLVDDDFGKAGELGLTGRQA